MIQLVINRSSRIYYTGERVELVVSHAGVLENATAAVFDTIDPRGSIELAIVMRRTGTVLAAWTKEEVPRDVVSVMAATMIGSIETMSEALGCPSPERATVETESCRMLAEKFGDQAVVVVVGKRETSAEALQRTARQILDRLSCAAKGGEKKVRSAVLPRA